MTTTSDPAGGARHRSPVGVVAAVDEGTATRPVLDVARRLADCLRRPVMAVHVHEDDLRHRATQQLADAAGVELVAVSGDPVTELDRISREPGVDALVLGAHRLATAPQRLGHVADTILHRPPPALLVLVPAGHVPVRRAHGRVLLPLDTDDRCAAASGAVADRLRDAGCEVVGVHVFEQATVPAFLDHPGHGTASWSREFARRRGLPDVELRRGAPGRRILETARDHDVDLVVLGWSCVLEQHRGQVVADVLAGAEVPVLLAPVTSAEDRP